jgi:hypothetical protein
MKKILLIITLILFIGCANKNKNNSKTEESKQSKEITKEQDSLVNFDKSVLKETNKTIKEIEERNSNTSNESSTNTTISYEGEEPLKVETPKGNFTLKGKGKVNINSSNSSKSVSETNQLLQQELSDKSIEIANYKIELNKQVKLRMNAESKLSEERTKVKVVEGTKGKLILWLIISVILNIVLGYFTIRRFFI